MSMNIKGGINMGFFNKKIVIKQEGEKFFIQKGRKWKKIPLNKYINLTNRKDCEVEVKNFNILPRVYVMPPLLNKVKVAGCK